MDAYAADTAARSELERVRAADAAAAVAAAETQRKKNEDAKEGWKKVSTDPFFTQMTPSQPPAGGPAPSTPRWHGMPPPRR